MIGIYDYSIELDDPRPMNHGNIISIFAYLLHRSFTDEEIDDFLSIVGPEFMLKICSPEYDRFELLNDYELPQLIADWGEYKAVFTGNINTDGFNISLYYARNRVKPSDDKKYGFDTSDSDEEEENDGDCHILYREPIYLSPYYPHYWYQMYDYQTKYRHKGHPHGFWQESCNHINKCDCPTCSMNGNNDSDSDSENTESDIIYLPSSTEMDIIWEGSISHKTLIEDIEIFQQ